MVHIARFEENPLITPEDVTPLHRGFEVIGAFNAGAVEYKGETLLLLRVAERPINRDPTVVKVPVFRPETGKTDVVVLRRDDPAYDFSDPRVVLDSGSGLFVYLTSLSYLRLARSSDGRRFTIDDRPIIYPAGDLERFGIEDPRIALIGDTYYISYSSASAAGVGVSLASTNDFSHVRRLGMIFAPENKDVVIFPEKIHGKYYAFHRPVPRSAGAPEIWIAESDNLRQWGNHRRVMGLRAGMWDDGRIGAGTVPIKTKAGWLEFYHGASKEDRYCMGAVLLDADDPAKVLARSASPVLEPEAPYETGGFFGAVVFSCGMVVKGDMIRMYYGISDSATAGAELSLQEVLGSLR